VGTHEACLSSDVAEHNLILPLLIKEVEQDQQLNLGETK
jgi:hypothetical protein